MTMPVQPIGLAALTRLAFQGRDLSPLITALLERLDAEPTDAAALIDLATLHQLIGRREEGLTFQAGALALTRIYVQPAARPEALKLLAFVTAGDFMANTPLDFMIEDGDVTLYRVYVAPGTPLPQPLPDHDLAIVAIGEADGNIAALDHLDRILNPWPRPVLNPAARIRSLSRERLWPLLHGAPGIAIPPTLRVTRAALAPIAAGADLTTLLPDGAWPVILRPVDSHAGHGLEKLDDPGALAAYLSGCADETFYLSPFVNYRSPDGLFRKYRIALIGGRPYLCHLAMAEHWMLHYLNAGMDESAAKRAEEAAAMADFDRTFAARHRAAFQALSDRVGLDYFAIDCAETPPEHGSAGRLLIFEADVAMIIHAMDPPDLYPYKAPQMRRVFAGFRALLADRTR